MMVMSEWSASLKDWIVEHSELTSLAEIRRLRGATSSHLYLLNDADKNRAVIRFYTNKEWLRNEPDLAEHEAAALQKANMTKINTPKLLAYTYNEDITPYPAVLMSYLPGEVTLPKTEINDWLKSLAKLMAEFHASPISDTFLWTYRAYNDVQSLSAPNWTRYKAELNEAIHLVKSYEAHSNTGFIHRDFHPVNVLWEKGEATGIVDWPNACRGPKEVDVGHCRLNLALLYGVETADLFLQYYIEETKTNITDQTYWDLTTLFDCLPDPGVYEPWLEYGMDHLSDSLIKDRFDDYFLSIYHAIVKN